MQTRLDSSEARRVLFGLAQRHTVHVSELEAQGVVEIVGPDLTLMLSFYETLGFKTERRVGLFAVIVGYGVRLFLAENASATSVKRWTNLRILVDDAEIVWRCVTALDIAVAHTIAERPYGLKDFVLADPAGFEIRFAQVL